VSDYSAMSTEGIDAILEVGVAGYEHRDDDTLCLLVQVRLVNPATKAVLGRALHETLHAVDPSRSFFRFRRSA